MKKEIKELVDFALSDNLNKHKTITIGTVNKKQAVIMKKETGINLYECERTLDTFVIRHILRKHGSVKMEANRGQVAINLDDFENIPHYIAKAYKIEYLGKNKLNQDSFQYYTEDKGTIVIIEAVRINKYGNKISIETMYKMKKSNRK